MNYSVMYLFCDSIYYTKSKDSEIIKCNLPKKVLKYGKINCKKSFNKYLTKFLDEHGLLKFFIGGNIKVIVDDTFNESDKYIFTEILKELNYSKVEFLNLKSLFPSYKNKVYIIENKDLILGIYEVNNKVVTDVICIEDLNLLNLTNFYSNKFRNYKIFVGGNASLEAGEMCYIYQDIVSYLIEKVYILNK